MATLGEDITILSKYLFSLFVVLFSFIEMFLQKLCCLGVKIFCVTLISMLTKKKSEFQL